MEEFVEKIAEIFEVDTKDLSLESDFRKIVDTFDSMMGFSILCMISDDYGVDISVPDFLKCKTIADLYQYTQKK